MASEGKKDFAGLKRAFLERLDVIGSVAAAADELGLNRSTAGVWAWKAGRRSEAPRRRRGHPGRGEYERLRAQGVSQRRAAEQAGVNERTARDWDRGVKKNRDTRTYPGGVRVDYAAGTVTMEGVTSSAPRGGRPAAGVRRRRAAEAVVARAGLPCSG